MASILILDERKTRRRYLRTLLEKWGYSTYESDSAESALERMRHAPPDLVLLDVLMPNPGGYQFVLRLNNQPDASPQRVMFLFAPFMESEARRLAQACGVTHLVAESASVTTLRNALRSAIAGPPPARANAQASDTPDTCGTLLSPVVSRLFGRVAELETSSTRLKRKAAASAAKLAVARCALDREVIKRLWTEEDLAGENTRLREQSMRDPLTGLYNRRYLDESLAREESRARRSGRPFCVMMIDIDHFKNCNDSYGHAAGDQVLYAISRCMESMARPEDILCRYGGEEFVLVLTNIVPSTLWQRADSLRASVPKLDIVHDQRPIGPITLSIGLAIFPDDGSTAHEVLRVADSALYLAKKSGRDRVVASGAAQPGLNTKDFLSQDPVFAAAAT